MRSQREVVCTCGHVMTGRDDDDLYQKVRRHVDDEHPELNWTQSDIQLYVNTKAYDV
jgi:predicted small metal-binding protein